MTARAALLVTAWVLCLLTASPAGAYVFYNACPGGCRWQDGNTTPVFDTNLESAPGFVDSSNIDSAIQPWNNAGTVLQFQRGSMTSTEHNSPDVTPTWDGQNTISFEDFSGNCTEGCTLGVATWRAQAGYINECDVRLRLQNDGGFDWNGRTESFFEAVLAHEMGHCVALDHPDDSSALMYYSIASNRGPTLGTDDTTGISVLYGKNIPALSGLGMVLLGGLLALRLKKRRRLP